MGPLVTVFVSEARVDNQRQKYRSSEVDRRIRFYENDSGEVGSSALDVLSLILKAAMTGLWY